jgi:hypothetical protein
MEIGKKVEGLGFVAEGARYNCTARGHTLTLSLSAPAADEIEAVAKGRVELRVLGNELALLVLFRFEFEGRYEIPWSDAPFEWHRNKPESRFVPAEEQSFDWSVILLDTDTQILKAARYITPDAAFQRSLHKGIRLQAERTREPPQAEVDRYLAYLRSFPSKKLAEIAQGFPNGDNRASALTVSFGVTMRSFATGKTARILH